MSAISRPRHVAPGHRPRHRAHQADIAAAGSTPENRKRASAKARTALEFVASTYGLDDYVGKARALLPQVPDLGGVE